MEAAGESLSQASDYSATAVSEIQVPFCHDGLQWSLVVLAQVELQKEPGRCYLAQQIWAGNMPYKSVIPVQEAVEAEAD